MIISSTCLKPQVAVNSFWPSKVSIASHLGCKRMKAICNTYVCHEGNKSIFHTACMRYQDKASQEYVWYF